VRSFIAINIPSDIKKKLYSDYKKYRDELKVRWVKPENLHITLKFLGNCSYNKIYNLCNNLDSYLHGFGEFNIQIGGYAAFPKGKNPRVIWIKALSESSKLIEICNIVDSISSKSGFPKEIRKPVPHITIARIREPLNIYLSNLNLSENIYEFKCKGVEIFKSTLTRNGSIYEVIDTIIL